MKKYMNENKEDIIAIITALFVIFSAIIDPLVSAVILIVILFCIGIWNITTSDVVVNKNG
jgi:integral membrane sensor domain MASE1